MSPGNRKRLGEFLILFIYLLAEGYGLKDISWPLPHFWALAAGVAGFIALLFLDGEFSGHQIFQYGATAFVVCIVIYFVWPPIVPEETVRHGLLVPSSDPTPSTGCDPAGNPRDTPFSGFRSPFGGFGMRGTKRPTIELPKDAAIVAIGSNGVILSTSEKVPLIRVGECTLLSMQKR
jgi:hypothetical protein